MPRPYPKEFKQGALDLVERGDRPMAEIAHELGIAESCLRRWVKQSQLDRHKRDDGLTTHLSAKSSLDCDARTRDSGRRRRS